MRPSSKKGARQRILESAYELFSARGVRATGIKSIFDHAGAARMSLYQHFRSKDDLVVASLRMHEQRWTTEWLQREVRQREISPPARLLVIFDLFDEWFHDSSFEGCFFINVLVESHADGANRRAAVEHIENIFSFLQGLAEEAKIADAESFARIWHLLLKGSIVAAVEGNLNSARLGKIAGEIVLKNWPGQSG